MLEDANYMSIYDRQVIQGIISDNQFGIDSVNSLQQVQYIAFDRDRYPEIVALIEAGKIDHIERKDDVQLPARSSDIKEFLDIITFKDQQDRNYIATIYNSDSLYQDPEIIDIFKVV
ncbi:hypothetical protein U0035_06265 [Niabella yanshanensis]|uniref:Uncharacterized protein n=1 Tax=Niabella yanshanensis TaxID=577386 RepID=A0ABZ0WB90_9BACT|nr:hypothetical protein [Niabella yanshanensis]WQD39749.1 hypothetical protein U0035_06265 [Niabella yanshanensis]